MKFHQLRVLTSEYFLDCSPRIFGVILAIALGASPIGYAYAATSITQTTGAGDLGTNVTQSGNVYGITGGNPVGTNLFHSFSQFSVATGDIAQFQTTPLIPNMTIHNILGRVTSTNPSTIFGTIDSITYYPNANLFLMNPNGILLGPGAQINVGGMANFTTADYLRLTDNIRFGAVPGAQDALLSTASVAAFGFLGSEPSAIAVQGSQLTVANGTGLSLVGGNHGFTYTNPDTDATASVPGGVTMTGGTLSAPSVQINLASVASPGEVSAVDFTPASGMTMGGINLSQGATLDVSGNAAGTIRIRGGQLVIADATISADTFNANGASTAVDIQLTGDLSIANDLVPAITARTTGVGDAGAVNISSANLTATSNTLDILTLIDMHTSGAGKAGDVNITTGNLQVTGSLEGFATFIDSGTEGPGHGGDVTINAQNVQIDFSVINTGNFWANNFGIDATGSAGNVNISTGSLNITFSQIVTDAFSSANLTGKSGNVTITAHDINLDTTPISAQGIRQGGAIIINTDQLTATNSQIIAQTNLTAGGGVTITGKSIELSTGSNVVSSTGGNGAAGPITITATDHLSFLGASPADRPSGIFSNSFGTLGSRGNSGNIFITTPRLEMTGGARINSITSTSGHGGNVTINAMDTISMSGESGSSAPEPLFSLGTTHSGIFTRTIGGHCSGLCGAAGNVSITTGSLTVGTGAQIDTGTSTTGHGGNITIHSADTISVSGILSAGSPAGIFSRTTGTSPKSGTGGDIALTAGQSVTISNGASVSASSTGPGNAGNIVINAGQTFTATNSHDAVTTQANASSGGNITVKATDTVQLTNSNINASVSDGPSGGGNITIDPQYVILQNSQILAQADKGQGGAITITTNLFLPDAISRVNADSGQPGLNGTVTIQSPNSPASGKIQPLGNELLETTSLLNQRCAALAGGEFSSFTVSGRDSLPTEPGSWLASPLVAFGAGEALGLRRDGVPLGASLVSERTLLSLRQVAPTGFLTQAFAQDWSAGCQS